MFPFKLLTFQHKISNPLIDCCSIIVYLQMIQSHDRIVCVSLTHFNSDYIIENESLVNKFIFVPKDKGKVKRTKFYYQS